MNKLSYFLCLFFLIANSAFAQHKSTAANQWQKIELKDISFALPPAIKVPKGKYRELPNSDPKVKIYDTYEIIAESSVKTKKASIEIVTTVSDVGDYKKSANLNPLSENDIKSMNELNKKELSKKKDIYGNLIQYHPIKVEKINHIAIIHYGYKRQFPGKPVENISVFYSYDDDRIHQITFTCTAADSPYWKSDLDKIINGLQITTVR